MTTVLACYPPGLSGSGMYANWLQGWVHTEDRHMVNVPYTASLNADSITSGVAALDKMARETSGPVIGFGHSQGAQVCSDLLNYYMDNHEYSLADRLSFVVTGNPLRNPTGKLINGPVVGPLGTKGRITPENTPFKWLDIARQHDGWAIKGNWWNFRQMIGMWVDHMNYNNVNVNDSNPIERRIVGNTTYLVVP